MKRLLLVVALLATTLSWSAPQDSQPLTAQQKRQIAVWIMRTFNNAELDFRMRNGRYAALNEFAPAQLDTSRLRSSVPAMPSIDPNSSDPIPGFNVRITVAADGQSYSIKLSDKERGNCGTDAFTDDVGLIYLAGPIDCNFSALQPFSSGQPVAGVQMVAPTQPPAQSNSTTGMTVRISPGVAESNLQSRVDPEYPLIARQARLQGSVVMQVLIAPDGRVTNIQIVSGHPMLVQAGIEAVKQWRYKPYLLNGEPVTVATQVAVNFTLPE